MISLYSGTPRSGKSLHAAERIIARSRLGKPVVGNFPCNLSRYKRADYTYVPNDKLTPKFLKQYSLDYFKDKRVKEGAILLVIDECQLLFNAREWQRKGRDGWLSFFTQHGKLGYDVILIAQNDRMIDRQIRAVVEYEYIHRKLNNFGLRGLLLRIGTLGCGFICVKVWYPLGEKLEQEFFRASKHVYSIYDTFILFDGSGDQTPAAPEPVRKKRKRSLIRAYVAWIWKHFPGFASWAASLGQPRYKGKWFRPGGRNELGWK